MLGRLRAELRARRAREWWELSRLGYRLQYRLLAPIIRGLSRLTGIPVETLARPIGRMLYTRRNQ